MTDNPKQQAGDSSTGQFLLGNEAIVRGALQAGVDYAAGYPGTPSSEIIERLSRVARERNLHVEWSTNEKVACEGAGAAATAGLNSLAAMKNAGLSVALDFLTHFSLTGVGEQAGAMVVVVCDDPNAHSSGDETDSRWLARFAYAPLLEPTSVQEARDLTRYAFELSRRHRCYVMLRSYTRLSHASSLVEMGELPPRQAKKAASDTATCVTPYLGRPAHAAVIAKLEKVREEFEESPFNSYQGPDKPELLIVTSGSGYPCACEAVELLGLQERVGILKIVTLWPFPHQMVRKQLARAPRVLAVEEVDPVLELLVKECIADGGLEGIKVLGKQSGHLKPFGEITPDRVLEALGNIFDISASPRTREYQAAAGEAASQLLISRGLTWCPGCPHRASFWALERAVKAEGGEVYITGDIGCYTLDVFPEGKCQMNLLHAMGSGIGLASGLGQLGRFDYPQKVLSICGDSTFFHASIPGLINAVYNKANLVQVVLDNDATAMTGFQAHPGVGYNAVGDPTNRIDIVEFCRSLGVPVVEADPFELRQTTKTIRRLLNEPEGVRVLVLRRACELVRMKRTRSKPFAMAVNPEECRGAECTICYAKLRCPAFVTEGETGKAMIREEACPGCGVCADICPFKAISRKEVA